MMDGIHIEYIIAARKETYSRFMQYKDETNSDILEEVKHEGHGYECI
jgi:hypothetical protein